RTGKSAVLRSLYPQDPYVEIHPEDARELGITCQQRTCVESAAGSVECVAFVTPSVQRGHVFIPMHYDITNRLTQPEYDPQSRQPSYKHCPVRIRPSSTSSNVEIHESR
ncbi:MAG: nitrate reductase, partial [Verrucomicrobia bacterium]|nr:nitrate reductase [Verrucomicrobiota bacterium]